jgi:hypothetical protein
MKALRTAILILSALWELVRYELLLRAGGFRSIQENMRRPVRRSRLVSGIAEAEICQAVGWALCLYWKPVLCLQRSVATARLLRKQRLDARVVVGCRPEPFVSHAWVELAGRVVNDSQQYKTMLPPLLQL